MPALNLSSSSAPRLLRSTSAPAALLRTSEPGALELSTPVLRTIDVGEGAPTGVDLGTRPEPAELIAGALMHRQVLAVAEWRGVHPFARLPDVTCYVDGEEVDTDVHATETTYLITWPTPTSGVAVIR